MAKSGDPKVLENDMLRMKFNSLTYTAPKRQQKVREVTEEGKDSQNRESYQLWKRLNPGYFEEPPETTSRTAQKYDANDFVVVDKERFRQKDKHTEYVEYVVRDHALARKNAGGSPRK